MIGRGLLALALLSNCVLSLPVTSSQLENEDAKVMKCIVEALTDVVSRSHPLPVSQECLVTLKTDDRLVSILRHHSFLRELQEIALEGDKERAEQRNVPSSQTPLAVSDVADRSMLEALGSPGERSILSEKKRRTGTGDGDGEEGKPASFLEEESLARRSSQEQPGESGEADKRSGREKDGEKRAESEEGSKEENKGAGSAGKRQAPTHKSRAKTLNRDEDKDKRSLLFSHQQEEKQESREDEEGEEEAKRGGVERSPWTKRGKILPVKKKKKEQEQEEEEEKEAAEAQQLSSQQEVPHHSKELSKEEEVAKKDGEEEEREEEDVEEGQKKRKKKRNWQKTPEEKELQMMASKQPEEKRASEEEGSAGRKSEEQEIESLAAIESELENVAQKLHDLRRG